MTSLITGAVTVTSAGTAVQFSTAQNPIRSIRIVATGTNTGAVYVGASDVDNTNSPLMVPGASLPVDWTESTGRPGLLSDLWVDADNNNDEIRYWAVPV